jgi:hypothetical protein
MKETLDLFGFVSKRRALDAIGILENPYSLNVLENWCFSSKGHYLEKPWRAKAAKKRGAWCNFHVSPPKIRKKKQIQT